MGKNKPLTEFEQGQVAGLKRSGKSISFIAREIGRSRHAVQNFLDQGENYGRNHAGGGTPKLSPRDARRILQEASNNNVSRAQIVSNLQLPVSKWTVGRVLNGSATIKYTKMKGKPPLTPQHQEKRLAWAKDHMTWNKEWSNVVFSDEKSGIWMDQMVFTRIGMI